MSEPSLPELEAERDRLFAPLPSGCPRPREPPLAAAEGNHRLVTRWLLSAGGDRATMVLEQEGAER